MSIQIFILSKLMEDNNYPYKLKKQLSEPIPLDQLSGLTESKLYYHFDTLAKQGLIETVEIIKEEHRPDKQVFGITAKGREELPKKIYKEFEKSTGIGEMVVAIANIKYVERGKVITILEKKLDAIKARWEQISSIDAEKHVGEAHQNIREFMEGYVSTRMEHTIYWLEELIRRVERKEI
ncbi:PadR family transcriptional regulator [Bacillus infantis]|uniref:PadR family transcriptional regulator n=1 Tax=Bacillus infantis TaxID=324767 RepID=A0A5D4R8E0_9BACI|nr:helix-turn-helix transcriptional regulator [Bacillus infantis]TYS47645.1 PadR family transcriptional regulator [Bacillus infantis]